MLEMPVLGFLMCVLWGRLSMLATYYSMKPEVFSFWLFIGAGYLVNCSLGLLAFCTCQARLAFPAVYGEEMPLVVTCGFLVGGVGCFLATAWPSAWLVK